MSKGFIMGINGGGGKLFAAIGVTYPEGSNLTCKCKETGDELKAKTATGQYVFSIPYAGTWTVTATDKADSTKTKDKSVSVTEEGQFESIKLEYNLVLFAPNVTDKMSIGFHLSKDSGLASLTVGNTAKITTQSNGAISYMSNEEIDLTEYKVLKCTNVTSTGNAYLVIDTARADNPAEGTAVFTAATTDNSLPLESYNGKYYVGIACGFGSVKEISQLVLE